MVDRVSLGQVNQLNRDFAQIAQVLRNFDDGGVIVAMTVSPGGIPVEVLHAMPPPVPGTGVSTVGITYPPQMVDAIKQSLRTRQEEIGKQLEELGVTGIEESLQEPAPLEAHPAAPTTIRPAPPRRK